MDLSGVDLLELARDYTELRRVGREWRGLCPLHSESNPSFYVDPDAGVWYCFGCGRGGDAIDLVRLRERVGYREAVEILARRFGIVLEVSEEEAEVVQRERHVEDVLAAVAALCAKALPGSPGADYLTRRGIPVEVARRAGVGWCGPEQYRAIVAIERKHQVGLLRSDSYPAGVGVPELAGRHVLWAHRIVVPMHLHRRVVNLYTRAVHDVDARWRHRYVAERPRGLFYTVPLDDVVAVVEGPLDWLSCLAAGVSAVGVGGATRNPPEALVKRLARLLRRCERVVVMFDADQTKGDGPPPGQAAAVELAAALAAEGLAVTVADLGQFGGGDPNDVLRREGPSALREAVQAALPMAEFADRYGVRTERPLLERVEGAPALRRGRWLLRAEHYDASDPAGVRAVVTVQDAETGEVLARDRVALWSRVARQRLVNDVGVNGKVGKELHRGLLRLDQELRKLIAMQAGLAAEREREEPQMTEEERAEAEAFLRHPLLLSQVIKDVHALGVVGEDIGVALLYLAMTSRLMDDPLFVCVKASSSSGKSFLAGTVASLCPPEDLRDLTRITPRALYYVPRDWARHKLLIIRERAGAEGEQADYSIRTMLSEKGLHLLAAQKVGDQIVSEERIVEGPLAYIETTTALDINPENVTRMYELYLDESPEQTAAIQRKQRELVLPEAMRRVVDVERIRRKHHNAQRLLERGLQVAIPYAHLLDFPAERPRHRRDHMKFLRLIQAIAFLYQKQREVHTIEVPGGRIRYINATLSDYAIAYWLASELLVPMLMELDERSRQLYDAILEEARRRVQERAPTLDGKSDSEALLEIEFVMKDFYPLVPFSKYQVRECVRNLVMQDFLVQDGGGKRGRTAHYRLAFVVDDPWSALKLVPPDELEERCKEEGLQVE